MAAFHDLPGNYITWQIKLSTADIDREFEEIVKYLVWPVGAMHMPHVFGQVAGRGGRLRAECAFKRFFS